MNRAQSFYQYLEKISDRGVKPGLERIKAALAELGHPEKKVPTIHLAGTNGKGSVCGLLAQFLAASGYRVGVTISPHITEYRERIQIYDHKNFVNSYFIPYPIAEEFLFDTHDEIQKNLKKDFGLTYFEYGILLAIVCFAKMKLDFCILETGLGGRLDATNVCPSFLSGITSLGLDHMNLLGKTLPEILNEKLHIIKKGSAFLCCDLPGDLSRQAREFCGQVGARYFSVSEVKKTLSPAILKATEIPDKPRTFSENLIFTLCLVKLFSAASENSFSEAALRKFLALPKKNFPPARYEIVHQGPKIIIDGAHNEPAFRILKDHLKTAENDSYDLYFGCLSDRDADFLASIMSPARGQCYWMCFDGEDRSPTPKTYEGLQKKYGGKIFKVDQEFFNHITQTGQTKIVCGSLYLCAQVRKQFQEFKTWS